MELKVATEKQKTIISSVLNNRISFALRGISELAYASRDGEYINEFENLEQTYENILKYTFRGTKDPERDKIFSGLKRRLLELTDDLIAVIVTNSSNWIATQKRSEDTFMRLGEQEKSAIIDQMTIEQEFSALLEDIEPAESANLEGKQKYDDSLGYVFSILWLTDNYSEGERMLARRLVSANHIPWYDKSLIVSAISLSMIRHFDHTKAELLFEIYQNGEKEVWHRALVGLVFCILHYQSRLVLYPEITNRFKSYANPEKLGKSIEQIILQIIRSQETEKVTEKIQKEIIPEVMKLRPDLEEKLKLDELLSEDNLEDKNPDWEQFFSDTPGVYKKLEEFSMMQMDGSDVFMGAFSMLKRFGFFEKISNWFLPFYKEHPEIQKSVKGVGDGFDWNDFFLGIEQAPVMCNSDKYSFSFNIGFMPDMQKNMMLEMFKMELNQMKEVMSEENKHNSIAQDKQFFTQYIQDLYRFFKLYPNKNEFEDIFSIKLDVTNSAFFKLVLSNDNIRKIGEFYFQKNYYKEARDIFINLLCEEKQFELIEKVGFCFQKTGDFEEAIEYYKQAEILDTNRTWLHKKLGYCYRSLGQFDLAIEYYTKAEHHEPDELEIQILLGQLHIDKEDYETALKYYFKVEYLKPDLVKVQRPIAWCSFLLGKTEQAIRYFKKVSASEGQRSDFLNLGHCLWVQGKLEEAIQNYREAFKRSAGDVEWFTTAISSDSIYLKKHNIQEVDIALMADFITFGDL